MFHTSSFTSTSNKILPLIATLAGFRNEEGIVACLTPLPSGIGLPDFLTTVPSLTYDPPDPAPNADFTAILPIANGDQSMWCFNRWNPSILEEVTGARPPESRYSALMDGLLGLEASEAIGDHLFVTSNDDLLSYRDRIQDQISVFILTPEEALDYLDVHFKRKGRYLYAPSSYVTGIHGYYFGRIQELVPNFGQSWSAAIYGDPELPNGQQILAHMESFYLRMLSMLEAKDRVADQYYRPANNDTLYFMLRELNAFMPLATGTFDSLAWICNYMYELGVTEDNEDTRRKVILKLRAKQTTNFVIADVERRNKRLATLLKAPATQELLNIFYPSRDSIQHRHPLNGVTYVRADISNTGRLSPKDEEKGFSLAILDNDTSAAIELLDQADDSDYFSLWGVRFTEQHHLLEPYKFVRRALKELLKFYDDVFEKFVLHNHSALSFDTKRDIEYVEAQRKSRRSFRIPFLLDSENPPIGRSFAAINRMANSQSEQPGRVGRDKLSMALYGAHTLFADLIKINRPPGF